MGNVPISCCRSKSPRLQSSSKSDRNGQDGQYSTKNHDSRGGKHSSKTRQSDDYDASSQPTHILQHISEREPDDSETDPSSNPLNRPIFAARSSKSKSNNYTDSYSSNNSTSRRQNTPLMSSQDYGYNSTTSTNLTHYDGLLDDSFDSVIHRQQQPLKDHDGSFPKECNNLEGSRLLLLDSSALSEMDKFSSIVDRFRDAKIDKDSRFYGSDRLKSSSCSTIFIDGSTISQPNLDQTIKCVSLAIYYHIRNRTSDGCAEIFDESIHPLRMPSNTAGEIRDELITFAQDEAKFGRVDEPDIKTIYNFVKTLFKAAQLTSEYAITTLVYLERLMTYAEMDLTPKTWRRMFLGAILLSSKVWEDQAVWNVDYAQILEEISVEDINELERQFLELIQFNMNVPSSVYAKYYFHLRILALRNGLSTNYNLLNIGEAKTLEAMSRIHTVDWHSSPIHRRLTPTIKRHTSLEKLRLNGHAIAILM